MGSRLSAFDTERLRVAPRAAQLGDPAKRAALEAALPPLLREPVLRHLPAGLQDTADLSAWIATRHANSTVLTAHQGNGLAALLFVREDPPRYHIGYMLPQSHWGKGLASELLRGLLAALPHPATVSAGVDNANKASARVLLKCGFHERASTAPDTRSFECSLP